MNTFEMLYRQIIPTAKDKGCIHFKMFIHWNEVDCNLCKNICEI